MANGEFLNRDVEQNGFNGLTGGFLNVEGRDKARVQVNQ
jgi:hypothetical protein